MGDVVNLKQIRKRTEQEKAAQQADINRVRFGRTKIERERDKAKAIRANAVLDQHRVAPEDGR